MWIVRIQDFDVDALECDSDILGAQNAKLEKNRFILQQATQKDDTDLVAAMQKFKDISGWIIEIYPYFDDAEQGALIRAVGRPERGGQEQVLGVYVEDFALVIELAQNLMDNNYIHTHRLFIGAELIFTDKLAKDFEAATGIKIVQKQIEQAENNVSGEEAQARLAYLTSAKSLTKAEFAEIESMHKLSIDLIGKSFLKSMKNNPLSVSVLNLDALAKFKAALVK